MNNATYNGWANYATWRVNLEIIDGMTIADFGGSSRSTVWDVYLNVREYVEELIESTTQEGIGRDYALAFISDVDWREITRHLIDAAKEDDDEEDGDEEESAA